MRTKSIVGWLRDPELIRMQSASRAIEGVVALDTGQEEDCDVVARSEVDETSVRTVFGCR